MVTSGTHDFVKGQRYASVCCSASVNFAVLEVATLA